MKPLQRLELVRIDGEKVAGLVVEAIVAGEQHQRGGVGRLDDHLRDRDVELPDAPPAGSLLIENGLP